MLSKEIRRGKSSMANGDYSNIALDSSLTLSSLKEHLDAYDVEIFTTACNKEYILGAAGAIFVIKGVDGKWYDQNNAEVV